VTHASFGRFDLVLPEGSRYASGAGALRTALRTPLAGLRAFRLPLRPDFQQERYNGQEIYDGTR
jgi:hypothetical protein